MSFPNERGDDFAERGADDDAHRHVDHIAFHGKFFELTSNAHDSVPSLLIRKIRFAI
jgi:hypothetical protein